MIYIKLYYVIAALSEILGVNSFDLQPRVEPKQTPRPIQVGHAKWWIVTYGPWTPFSITVGEPAQNLLVFPSTSLSETYIVGSGGCPQNISNIEGYQCDISRGYLYNEFRSNTFERIANTENNSSYASQKIKGALGRDIVTVGSAQNGTASSVVVFTSGNFTWFGLLGLNPRPGISYNAEQGGATELNLMQQLKASNQIPSLSYGYTAGSTSRKSVTNLTEQYDGRNHTHGSLILGGYDQERFKKNNVSFLMGTDYGRELLVAVQSMNLNLPSGDTFTSIVNSDQQSELWAAIDSSQPYLYLPIEICNKIAQAFDLTWDQEKDHYFFSDNMNPKQQQNLSLSIQIGPSADTSSTVNINLSYASLKKPYTDQIKPRNNRRYYFPIRNATNPGDYILGRTFLQDAYLIADYERNTFFVHEVLWPDSDSLARTVIQPIPSMRSDGKSTFDSYDTETILPTKRKSTMPKALIAAIAVGVFTLLSIVVLALLCFRRYSLRRYSERAYKAEDTEIPQVCEADSNQLHESAGLPIPEMESVEPAVPRMAGATVPPVELDGKAVLSSEMDRTVFEVPATAITNSSDKAITMPS